MTTEQEPQAQAGELEVVVWLLVERDGPCEFSYVQFEPTEGYEPCITLQSHREAMAALEDDLAAEREIAAHWLQQTTIRERAIAKKDAALKACVEALENIKSDYAAHDGKRWDIDDAITQAEKALK